MCYKSDICWIKVNKLRANILWQTGRCKTQPVCLRLQNTRYHCSDCVELDPAAHNRFLHCVNNKEEENSWRFYQGKLQKTIYIGIRQSVQFSYYSTFLTSAVKRLIASKINIFLCIIYVCVLCIFIMHIQIHTHTLCILKIFTCLYLYSYNLYYK